ncbi:MAG: hypothetical protein WC227_01055 [Patescibacteria group bacterium]
MILNNKPEAVELLMSLGYREADGKFSKDNNEGHTVVVEFVETTTNDGTTVPIMVVADPYFTPGGVFRTSSEVFHYPIDAGSLHEGIGYFLHQEDIEVWVDEEGEEQSSSSNKNYCWI